ncbi:hypothetical protein ETTORE_0159 [Pseudomonas phage Ettore]|nr:hypothetical protein ETTORE_0159 [Pseudomonas phage Ettore]
MTQKTIYNGILLKHIITNYFYIYSKYQYIMIYVMSI